MPTKISRIDPLAHVVAATVYGEARGEGKLGMEAVAHVINNRVKANKIYFGRNHKDVCLKQYQFSVWDDKEEIEILEEKYFLIACEVTQDMLAGRSTDPTYGCDHYHANSISPDWIQRVQHVIDIGNHKFYKSID